MTVSSPNATRRVNGMVCEAVDVLRVGDVGGADDVVIAHVSEPTTTKATEAKTSRADKAAKTAERERLRQAKEADKERARIAREEQKAEKERLKEAVRAAKERVRAEKEAERERVRAEKEAEKERARVEKEAEKERVRSEKEAERQKLLTEKEAAKAKLLAEKEAERNERERIKAEKEAAKQAAQAERDAIKAEKEAVKAAELAEKEAAKAKLLAEKEAERNERERIKAEKEAAKQAAQAERDAIKAEKEAAKAAELAEKEAEQAKAEILKAKQANAFAKFFTPKPKARPVKSPSVNTPAISDALRDKLDSIIKSDKHDEDIDNIRVELLARWKQDKRRFATRWGERRVNADKDGVAVLCFNISRKRKRGDYVDGGCARRRRLYDIDGAEYERPAFWGTGTFPNRPSKPVVVTARRPFAKEADVDYDYDSAEEWEDAGPGESLSDADDDDDDDDELGGEEDDGFIANEDVEMIDFATFDPACIGDDERTARQRSTIAMLTNKAKRQQTPLIISRLEPRTSDAEEPDASLLGVFTGMTPFAAHVRISLDASTSRTSATAQNDAQTKSTNKSSHKMTKDDLVNTQLRELIEFLLRHPSLTINKAAGTFVEDASSRVAGLSQAAVKRKIQEVATRLNNKWIITVDALNSVDMTADDADALRTAVDSTRTAAKKRKTTATTATATKPAHSHTLETFFDTTAQTIPGATDSPIWVSSLQDVAKTKHLMAPFGKYEFLFNGSTLGACAQQGTMPSFVTSWLMKVATSKENVTFRMHCIVLLSSVIEALVHKTPESKEKPVTPPRASLQSLCADNQLRNAIEHLTHNDDVQLRETAIGLAGSLLGTQISEKVVSDLKSSSSFTMVLSERLLVAESKIQCVEILRVMFPNAVAVELYAGFHPEEGAKLAENILRVTLESSAENENTYASLVRLCHLFAQGAPRLVDATELEKIPADENI